MRAVLTGEGVPASMRAVGTVVLYRLARLSHRSVVRRSSIVAEKSSTPFVDIERGAGGRREPIPAARRYCRGQVRGRGARRNAT